MADVDLVRPAPRHTTSATDFASVALWAAAQRAELLQLTKELRALEAALPAPAPPRHLEDGDLPQAAPEVEIPLDTAAWHERGATHAYDLFWGEMPSDRPVRDRLRRFGQRSQP